MNVGIDLGTTNSALAYIDPRQADGADFPPIHVLAVPQQVDSDRVEPRRTLPSFLYVGDQGREQVGEWAREQGALVPTRSVHSAKSWLSNPEVDRTAKILPWDAQESGRIFSPVDVSARVLAHLRKAWDQAHGAGLALASANIVLTVPASFDEEARELTVMAAREAGLDNLTLLEEPAAAFYSWIANHLALSQKSLFDGQTVLVCDVGGGTSDFTLIRVNRDGDRVEFTRTAVGRHLLLGGDNLDLTLAWLVESKLSRQLSIRQRSALRRQCAAAKERLLADSKLPSVEITVLGAGSGLVGGTLKTSITREEALELTLEGFLPICELTDKPKEEKRSLFRELGLPYVSDPAVTRHLAAFLESVGARPDAVLFNGGFFIPEVCRTRVADCIAHWCGGARPLVLDNHDLDLAVAVGAAYYSYVRSTGAGLLVRGGLPRSYYIQTGAAEGDAALRTLCLMPRGTEEGDTLALDREDLQLVANRPVSFRLYSSLSRADDKLGDVVEFSPAEVDNTLHRHAPLQAVIRFGKRVEERLVPVRLGARLTEVGTLDIWAESRISEHRWRLQFELRKSAPAEGETAAPRMRPEAVVSDAALAAAQELLRAVFAPGASDIAPEEVPSRLEQAVGLGRGSWPLAAIRLLADTLLELESGRAKSAACEVRWLNLCGFFLRPGFGFPGDPLRVEQARRIYASGLAFSNQMQNQVEWWIFWGRVAGGMNRNQQVDMFQRLSPSLLPKVKGKAPRLNSSLLREMWRAASSLELLPLQTRTELGEALIRRVRAGDHGPSEYWCLARLGARELFYGPANQVLPPAPVARWVEVLAGIPAAAEALATMARHTGQPARDLPLAAVTMARRALERVPDAARLIPILEGETARDMQSMDRMFGEELPSGLVFGA